MVSNAHSFTHGQLESHPSNFQVRVNKGALREFEALRAAYEPHFEFDTLEPELRSEFEFDSHNFYMGATRLVHVNVSGWRYERSIRQASRSLSDGISIGFYLSGNHQGDLGHGDVAFGAGDIAVSLVDRPTRVISTAYESIRIIIERSTLEPFLSNVDKVHGLVLRNGTPMNRLLSTHLQELQRQVLKLSHSDAAALGQATATIAASCIGPSAANRDAFRPAMSLATLTLIRRTIEANLSQPDLDPDSVAKLCGVSRAALYRLTEPLGGVSRYIQERRLERARAEIVSPTRGNERIGAIAKKWGFTDTTVFSRSFLARYGMSPREASREWRNLAVTDPLRTVSDNGNFSALNNWLKTWQG